MALNREADGVSALNCGACGYSVIPRAVLLPLAHCPRCLAKRKVAVPLHETAGPVRRTGFRQWRPGQDGEAE